jgi:hypothetical protein
MLMLRRGGRKKTKRMVMWRCWKKRQLHSMTFSSRQAFVECRDSYTCVMNIHLMKKTSQTLSLTAFSPALFNVYHYNRSSS